MSGGVDSSVTAALLKEQGYDVTGVYMKNWSQDLPGFVCPWKEDYQDAKRVAVQLGIDFKMYDFETEYRQKVVEYMIAEYQAGRTPNPDIMCNQEVKFKLFLEAALEDGADFIATGHYSRIAPLDDPENTHPNPELTPRHPEPTPRHPELTPRHPELTPRHPELVSGSPKQSNGVPKQVRNDEAVGLFTGLDKNKDQSYFLYRVTEEALQRTLMPIGEMEKPEVRKIAKKLGLATAEKKDSQGICFVGKVGIKDFLLAELGPQENGPIIDESGKIIGEHDGAIFYTIGQRHGLNVGGGLPYYVSRKDMKANTVYVTTNLNDSNLWAKEIQLEDLHWINGKVSGSRLKVAEAQYSNLEPTPRHPELTPRHPELVSGSPPQNLKVRLRYRGPLVPCSLEGNKLILKEEQRGIAAGQSAVIYDGDHVLGGGIIS